VIKSEKLGILYRYYGKKKPTVINFYNEKAEKIIRQRVRKYLVYFEAKPSLLKAQSLKNKWESCSKTNQLRLNWRVVMAKMSILSHQI